jgi:O-antigen/teichoic acid export membrane protein
VSQDAHHKSAFFRQSGWLMIAGVASGALMWGVHFLAKKIPEAEYGTFGKMLAVTIILPVIPLQQVFARETAAALALGQTRALAGLIRKMLAAIFAVWLAGSAAVLWFQGGILEHWKVSQPATLWLLLLAVLASLVMPVFCGALQGAQNFLWLGGTMLVNGALRLSVAALSVFVLAATAAGVMTGVLAGLVATIAVAMWHSRALWTGPTEPFHWRALLRQMVPLMIGFTACQFLFSADTIFVGVFFPADETGFYAAAGTLSRALIWLVMPLATVMFPKLVHSAAKSEKSNLMRLTLVSTATLSIGGAAVLWALAPWVVKLVYKPTYVAVATAIIPWYAGGMVPLSLANVLINHLLARSDFRIVPWLAVLAAAYGVTLSQWHPSLTAVLQLLVGFNLVLLLVCALFSWGPLAAHKRAR